MEIKDVGEIDKIYRMAFDNAKDVLLLIDSDGNIVDANSEAVNCYGYSKAELLSMKIFKLRNSDLEYMRKQFQMAKTTGLEFTTFHVRKDGSKFPVEVNSMGMRVRNEILVISIIRDISNRIKSEEEIVYLASVVEHSKDAILSKDLNGFITSWNKGAEKLYGYKKHEAIGKHVSLIIPGDAKEDINLILDKTRKGQEIENYETLRVTKNKSKINVSLSVSPIYDLNDNVIGASTIARDITEKIRREKKLQQQYEELSSLYEELTATEEELRSNYVKLEKARNEAEQANLAKNNFLESITHEIRTPMNGIIGIIDLLSLTELRENQREYIKILKESSRLMLSVINSVLDISKIEAGKLQLNVTPFNMNRLLEKVVLEAKAMAVKKNLKLECNSEITVDEFLGDETKINQILLNLISNAIKFTNEGTISISIRQINKSEAKANLEFSISDTGVGIDESNNKKIFEKFIQQSATEGGSGLGLSISKELVNLMGGEIWFKSKLGEGSTFYFTVELMINKSVVRRELEEKMETSSIKPVENKCVLIVENNEISSRIISEMLKELKYNFILAQNGQEALEILKERNIDLIMMDIYMAGIDGFETTKIIRKSEKYIPIVAMTAYTLSIDKKTCIEAGMDDYITKPFNIDMIINILRKYL